MSARSKKVFASARIDYGCVREEHARPTPGFTLTIHNGAWAFCQRPDPEGTHRWMPDRYRLRWSASGLTPTSEPSVERLLRAAAGIWSELADALALVRLDLELGPGPRPLTLTFEIERTSTASQTFIAPLEIPIGDGSWSIGVARLQPEAPGRVSTRATQRADAIAQRHAPELRSCLDSLARPPSSLQA